MVIYGQFIKQFKRHNTDVVLVSKTKLCPEYGSVSGWHWHFLNWSDFTVNKLRSFRNIHHFLDFPWPWLGLFTSGSVV